MMGGVVASAIEEVAFAIVILICLYGMVMSYRRYKTLPGADLMLLGFLLYGAYALLAIFLPGWGGSYFNNFTLVGNLGKGTQLYFLSLALRLGLIFVLIGLYRIGRGMKT